MFVILLKFSHNKSQAGPLMDAHNIWIQRGFDEGVFLVVGSLQPPLGGAILAQAADLDEIEMRVQDDPFVAEGVVSADILEITPNRTDDRLKFLLG